MTSTSRLPSPTPAKFPLEDRFRPLRSLSEVSERPRARDCFRFLYHIIKLRQVLNNFSPSRPARRRRRFEGGDCLALRLQEENEKGESQERRARTGYNL